MFIVQNYVKKANFSEQSQKEFKPSSCYIFSFSAPLVAPVEARHLLY